MIWLMVMEKVDKWEIGGTVSALWWFKYVFSAFVIIFMASTIGYLRFVHSDTWQMNWGGI